MFLCTVPLNPDFETTYEDKAITTPEERLRAFGAKDHNRLFGSDFADILKFFGFRVEVINGNNLPSEIVPICFPTRLDRNELYVCIK